MAIPSRSSYRNAHMRYVNLLLLVYAGLILFVNSSYAQTTPTSTDEISVSDNGKRLVVNIGQELFTRYDYTSYRKPIFYPVLGPKQLPMTRNFPMKRDVAGEASDHPHHKSMWIGHEINGFDFWTEKEGRIELQKIQVTEQGFNAQHRWIADENDELVLTDHLQVQFSAASDIRHIDCAIEFTAGSKPVIFEDTKEGTFAIRVHPQLRVQPVKGNTQSESAKMKNANGETGKSVWGKPSRWVSYSGAIDGQPCGITIFDHPANLRHPTTWHARDYGLFAANPFGLHYFNREPKGAGQHELSPGKSLILRYRVSLHLRERTTAELNAWHKAFANSN